MPERRPSPAVMAKSPQMLNNAIKQRNSHHSDESFEWSLKPLTLWFKVLSGIQLNCGFTKNSATRCSWWGLMVFGAIVLLFDLGFFSVWSVLTVNILVNNKAGFNGTNTTSANRLSMGIEHCNNMFFICGVHIAFFAISHTKWKRLWNTLLYIEHYMDLTKKFYVRCRRLVYLGFLFIAIDCGVTWAVSTKMSNVENSPRPFGTIAYVLYNIFYCCASTIIVLFLVLTSITSNLFHVLRKRMQRLIANTINQSSDLEMSSSPLVNLELEKWRHHHAVVSELAIRLNRCFGWVLLIAVGHGFVTIITNSFHLVETTYLTSLPIWTVYATLFVSKLIHLVFITYTADHLSSQGEKLNKVLFHLRPSPHLRTHMLVDMILSQVSRNHPSVTACNFFGVDYSLFPSLIGTTLTYCIILCQASVNG